MSKNRLLYILMAAIICFSPIIEVCANLSKERFRRDNFIALREQRKDVFVQITSGGVMSISGQKSGKNSCSLIGLIGSKVERMIFTVVALFFGIKVVWILKTWAEAKFSRAIEEWRDSLYH
ncbi:hypothetical protein GGR08_000975 [Bartonella fuyuanensis]|uniref:Uncharacterized protein n=1 Tax=Bartonella fuyuanensis TaxID=1460968 RepID=A0A840E4E5_9HYPH|nr:hypothetical protein [Bartonella fuyuanensis]MBB4076669.1 hypothetical protein [Bartonella fuyuanensis]